MRPHGLKSMLFDIRPATVSLWVSRCPGRAGRWFDGDEERPLGIDCGVDIATMEQAARYDEWLLTPRVVPAIEKLQEYSTYL